MFTDTSVDPKSFSLSKWSTEMYMRNNETKLIDGADRDEKRKWNRFFQCNWRSRYSIIRAKNARIYIIFSPFLFNSFSKKKGEKREERKSSSTRVFTRLKYFALKFSSFLAPRAWWRCAKKKKRENRERIYKRNNVRLIEKLTYHSVVLSNVVF